MLYQLLSSERPDALTGKVNEALQNGWELHGTTTATSSGSNLNYIQAVVMTPVEENNEPEQADDKRAAEQALKEERMKKRNAY